MVNYIKGENMENIKTNQEQHHIYLDNLGRLLMGKKVIDDCTPQITVIKNPVIIDIRSLEEGGINIKFFPVMFREFQADKNEGSIWEYPSTSIVSSRPIAIDARLIGQYEQIFAPIANTMPVMGGGVQVQNQNNTTEPVKVLKLFDD